ncbi:MAG TPA: PilZ domain-containing protein [Candidatus Acidoferrales bacterium]|nr:PilZ domain-containing protein [Candidatus Acidoferrales bacterium]
MNEKRFEPRYMCADFVKIVVHDAGRPPSELIANLEDISSSGACLQLDEAIREGAEMELVCAEFRMKGKVRYCRFTEIGYDVGVEFMDRGTWSRDRLEPQHLMDIPVGRTASGGAH